MAQTGTASAHSGGVTAGEDLTGYVSTVTLVYLTMGLGTTLTLFLFVTLAGNSGGMGAAGLLGYNTQLAQFFAFAWILLVFLGPVITTLVGFFVGRDVGMTAPGAIAGAAANVVGVLVTLVALFVVMIVLQSSSMGSQIGQVLIAFVGIGIGVGVTGAAGGAVGARSTAR